ncbi:MAG: Flp pilus assembly complex ATPase component TadA [Comamonadaceae bacterium]|nr:Flp pilus assembly complex ATPase component TadA [Comamonadaceae bacterium]
MLKLMIARPEGIILVTGPTGSGKTTTLYSVLNHINAEGVNIMTLEDPVEYPMAHDPPDLGGRGGQARLRQRHPLDDAPGPGRHPGRRDPRRGHRRNGLPRRHDRPPGVFHAAHQLGARRDPAPARHRHPARHHGRQHHRRRSPSAWCAGCARTASTPYQRRAARAAAARRRPPTAARRSSIAPAGCERCDFQGYRGRQAIMELLRMDADLDELVARRATAARNPQRRAGQGLPPAGRGRPAPRARRLHLARGSGARGRSDRAHVGGTMPLFCLQGHRPRRAASFSGRIDAMNLVDLEMRLRAHGSRLHQRRADQASGPTCRGGRCPRRELINFCFHLEQLTRAGVPILEGLTDLRDSRRPTRASARWWPA